MANSTTNLDLISASQSQKEVTANALFDAASPAMLFGRRAKASAGLVWGYYGGTLSVSGTPTAIANGTVTLTASATNYVEATAAGVVSANTVGFTAGRTRLYTVVTGTATVTSYSDWRTSGDGVGVTSVNGESGDVTLSAADVGADATGTAAGLIAAHEAAGNPHPGYLTQAEADALYSPLTGIPFDIFTYYPGVPPASAWMYRGKVARALTLAANCASSQGSASVAATGSTVWTIKKNGVSVATATWSAAGTVPAFATSGGVAQTFAAGDLLEIIGPATPDATLADPSITLVMTR